MTQHTRVTNLKFGDTVWWQGYPHHIIECELNDSGSYNVWMSPTDGLGLDVKYSFPKDTFFDLLAQF